MHTTVQERIQNLVDFINTKIALNTTSENEHEPFSERFNRVRKERCRMCYSTLPFTRIPRRMVVDLVYLQIYWINFTIPRYYISDLLNLGAIVLGRIYNYNLLCGSGTQFGEYVRTHETNRQHHEGQNGKCHHSETNDKLTRIVLLL